LCSCPTYCQDPNDLIEKFFQTYAKGEQGKALDDLYAGMKWKDRIADDVAKLKGQFLSLSDMLGAYHGHQEIGRKDIAQALMIVDHVVMFDRQPVRFRFTFYRPENA